MGKRGNQSAAKTAVKKPRVDSALTVVMDTVKKAAHLPEQCSTMLASMIPFSLAIASDERAECQQRIVGMVAETLEAMKSEMETTIRTEEAKLDDMKATMAELLGTVKEAEATLTERKEALQAANTSLAEATTTTNASQDVLTERQSAHAKCEANLASVQEDKSALEEAFKTHFHAPMEAGQGPHFKELEPFLKNMDIEKSMRQTLPGTCAKSKDDRGSFDQVILEQLEKTIAARISTLADTVASETSAVADCANAIKEAETEFNSKKEAQDQCSLTVEAAQKEQNDGEAALSKATEAVNAFRPQLEEATSLFDILKMKLQGFESGPLANFLTYQKKSVPVEVAPAVAPAGA